MRKNAPCPALQEANVHHHECAECDTPHTSQHAAAACCRPLDD